MRLNFSRSDLISEHACERDSFSGDKFFVELSETAINELKDIVIARKPRSFYYDLNSEDVGDFWFNARPECHDFLLDEAVHSAFISITSTGGGKYEFKLCLGTDCADIVYLDDDDEDGGIDWDSLDWDPFEICFNITAAMNAIIMSRCGDGYWKFNITK